MSDKTNAAGGIAAHIATGSGWGVLIASAAQAGVPSWVIGAIVVGVVVEKVLPAVQNSILTLIREFRKDNR